MEINMMMFNITKKILLVACVLAFCSGQFDAFGSDTDNDLNGNPGRRVAFANTDDSCPRHDMAPYKKVMHLPLAYVLAFFSEQFDAFGSDTDNDLNRIL